MSIQAGAAGFRSRFHRPGSSPGSGSGGSAGVASPPRFWYATSCRAAHASSTPQPRAVSARAGGPRNKRSAATILAALVLLAVFFRRPTRGSARKRIDSLAVLLFAENCRRRSVHAVLATASRRSTRSRSCGSAWSFSSVQHLKKAQPQPTSRQGTEGSRDLCRSSAATRSPSVLS